MLGSVTEQGLVMNIPSHLYKYRSLRTKKDRQYTSHILTHNKIYFAKYTEFNDPFDCNFHISAEGNNIAHTTKLRELNPDLSEAELDIRARGDLQANNIRKREKIIHKDIRQINKGVGIFSISAKRDNLLMWSHYSDCHRGICLEFKVIDGKLFGCDLSKVSYQEQYPDLSIYDDLDLEWTKRYLTTKACDWSYEEEWRILYRETGCKVFPAKELTSVILGARIPKRDQKLVLEWLSNSICEVQLYQAHECDDRFGLNITPV
jgi:hypothetical protein